MDKIKANTINEENKDEILNLLRDQEFIEKINSRELEKIINSLDFKSLFNIIQNKSILDKINTIETSIIEKDSIFFPNFLESSTLVLKSNHVMIYEMLNHLNNMTILYYLTIPYIREKLTDNEVIELLLNNDIPFNEVVENNYLFDSIPPHLLTIYINRLWLKNPCSKMLTKKVIKRLFDINNEVLDSIDLDEVNYLFETIRTKNILSIQESKVTISSYKALLSSYLVLGTRKTLDLINNGNKGLDINTVKAFINEIIEYDLTDFYSHNFAILHHLERNIFDNLEIINSKNQNTFKEKVLKNTYLNSVISLMIRNRFVTMDSAIGFLYTVNLQSNKLSRKNKVSIFCNDFVNYILSKKKKEREENIKDKVLKHYELKKKVRNNEYRKLYTTSLQRIILKLFIEALKGNIYDYAFKDDPSTLLETYQKFIKKNGVDKDYFLNQVLIPYSNGNFDITSFLENLGIHKPYNYNLYINQEQDKKIISKINNFIKEIKNKYKQDTLLEILNYLSYGTKITNKVHKKDLEKIEDIYLNTQTITKEFYINKESLDVKLEDTYEIKDDYELSSYLAMKEKIEEVIKKTFNYLNYYMDKFAIKEKHFKDLMRLTSNMTPTLPLSKVNYSLIVRTFTFEDLERIFGGFNFQQPFIKDKDLETILFESKILQLVAEGYFGDVINLGSIINNWQSIKDMSKTLNLDVKVLNILEINNLLKSNYKENELEKNPIMFV